MENRIGMIKENAKGSLMEIIQYHSYSDIVVRFNKHGNLVHTQYGNFLKGTVKSPYDKSVYGVGYLGEGEYKVSENGKQTLYYRTWKGMLRRCYGTLHKGNTTYQNCFVDESWHNFQNFSQWFDENYYEVNGERMNLDKDILIKGNKIYSPKTCIFVPQSINKLFIKSDSSRGKLPIGVFYEKTTGKYGAQWYKGYMGLFNTPEEAFYAYKVFKGNYIKEIAEKYNNKIPKLLYDAMLKYKVEFHD